MHILKNIHYVNNVIIYLLYGFENIHILSIIHILGFIKF